MRHNYLKSKKRRAARAGTKLRIQPQTTKPSKLLLTARSNYSGGREHEHRDASPRVAAQRNATLRSVRVKATELGFNKMGSPPAKADPLRTRREFAEQAKF